MWQWPMGIAGKALDGFSAGAGFYLPQAVNQFGQNLGAKFVQILTFGSSGSTQPLAVCLRC